MRFALLTTDAKVRVVKLPGEEWDPVRKARAAADIRFDGPTSNTADALMFAVELMKKQGASRRTENIVFVLTDGFDTAPQRLKMSLAHASSENVMVVGLGIGYFTDGIISSFPHYVVVNNFELLPDGLRQFFSGDVTLQRPESAYMTNLKKEIQQRQEDEVGILDTDDLWLSNMKRVYEEQVAEMNQHLRFANAPLIRLSSQLKIDICFVMDTTGSMRRHLKQAKNYIKTLAENIKAHVREIGKSAILRVGFVSYKFFGNKGHLENVPFTDNIDDFQRKVENIKCGGGAAFSKNEDTCGGLIEAMEFTWSGTAKFLVLIGERPDHMLNCPGCSPLTGCHGVQRVRNEILRLVRKMALEKINLFCVRITRYTAEDEERFEEEYKKVSPSGGFSLLDISGSGADTKLKSMIEDEIKNVIALDFM